MKFKPGDVVRFKTGTQLAEEFTKHWGTGPFVLTRQYSKNKWRAESLDGRPHMTPWDTEWSHTDDGDLILDTFLDAARKAVSSES